MRILKLNNRRFGTGREVRGGKGSAIRFVAIAAGAGRRIGDVEMEVRVRGSRDLDRYDSAAYRLR